MLRRTKIVCTLGPSTDNGDTLKRLMMEGMDVARFNFSHQTHKEHKTRYDKVCALRKELNLPIATLLDTKGPEIRLHTFKSKSVNLIAGQMFNLYTHEIVGDETGASMTYPGLIDDIDINSHILIDDGRIDLRVTKIDRDKIVCIVENGGNISDRKGVNVPGCSLSLPFVSEKDREDIEFGIKQGFDFIAASFTRSAKDIQEIRQILNENNCHDMHIIAKIENREGVDNIDEILRLVDGIMVARGDMGVEIPFEELPHIQKMLIKKAYRSGKIVITATQMLDSMVSNPRPTRAESSDVANAIYDGTSAIMLSGETAAGAFSVESCKTMVKIAEETEANIHYKKRFLFRESNQDNKNYGDITKAIAIATISTAHNLDANAIITVSMSGNTAKTISSYRPNVIIIGGSTNPKVCRQLNLSWGVYPVLLDIKDETKDLFDHALDTTVENGYVKHGDIVAITAGVPLGVAGTTNMLKVQVVGDVLVMGKGVTKKSAKGRVCVAKNDDEAMKKCKPGDILVMKETSDELLDIMKKCNGIITEVGGENSHSSTVGKSLNEPVIINAKNATKILKDGMYVVMDAQTGRVTDKI